MIKYRFTYRGHKIEGAGNAKIETNDGPITICANSNQIHFPRPTTVTVQVPDDKTQKPKTIFKTFTDTIELSPGPVGLYCPILPGGGIFGASQDWPTNSSIVTGCIIVATKKGGRLTGDARVLSTAESYNLVQTHRFFNTWNEFDEAISRGN